MQATLASLGIGKMPTYRSQADTLEGEVDNYLADQVQDANVIEFWQVCRVGHFIEGC